MLYYCDGDDGDGANFEGNLLRRQFGGSDCRLDHIDSLDTNLIGLIRDGS